MCLVAPGIHIIYPLSYALYVESSVVGIAVVTTLPHCEKLKLYPPAIAFSVYIVHPRHVPMHVMFQCTLCFNASHVPMHVMVQYTQCSNARHVPIFLIWKNGENIFSMIILNITLSIWQNINSILHCRDQKDAADIILHYIEDYLFYISNSLTFIINSLVYNMLNRYVNSCAKLKYMYAIFFFPTYFIENTTF